jgi:hypothetical protein
VYDDYVILGEQHYHDVPSGFNDLIYYQVHDQNKRIEAMKNDVRLFSIPFWWNFSFDSLLQTIISEHSLPPKNQEG